MKDNSVQITLFRWAGRKLFWEIRSECEECDRSVQSVREVLQTELKSAPIQFEVKNWLDHLSEALWHRGWHPPVILLNGNRFSQGVVPERDLLVQAIRALLAKGRPRCPICHRVLDELDYADHRKTETRRRVVNFIQTQHPEWVEQDGICPRCVSAYERLLEHQELVG